MKKYLTVLFLIICISHIFAQDSIFVALNVNNNMPTYTDKTVILQNYKMNDLELSFAYFVIPYFANNKLIPSISTSYYYRIKKWFWVGAMLNFNYVTPFTKYKNKDKGDYCYFGIAPTIRFSYINKSKFILYSGLAVGMETIFEEQKLNIANIPLIHITYLGFSYGNSLYIGAEIGTGFKGFLNINTGYKF